MKSKPWWFVIPLLLIAPSNDRPARAQVPKADPAGVSYWAGSEAFAKGPLLLDRTDTSSYQLYAVRRDKPGTVEQHALDTDIIMVLEGAATFVTGGSTIEAREVRPNEASGSGIRDGQSWQLGKGDVVIVPNGTPHWFRDVSPTITYFAVKLRQPSIQTHAPSGVMYWKGSEAFGKGGMLFDAKEGRFGRVYALRPSKPLGVELHGLDTDIVLVVEGTGTFVTEGTITEPRPTRPDEGTGTSIRDGNPRRLEKGAVLVIPKGTPHWLRQIDGTIDFFAVKTR